MRLLAVLRALLLAAVAAYCVQGVTAEPVDPPAIGHVEAHLFLNKTATWSEDILDPKSGELWNTIAGPGSSNAVLVVVEVTGAPGGTYTGFFGPRTKYAVRLIAKDAGRGVKVLDQSQGIPVLTDQGRAYVAFLVHQGGCKPIQLSASVVGHGAGKPVEKSLNFACGE